MSRDGEVAIAQGLQETNLLAFERDDAVERKVHKECADRQKNRWQGPVEVFEHVEYMIKPRMRGLILSSIGCPPTIGVEERVKPLDDLRFGSAVQQLEIDGRKCPLEIVGTGKGFFGHPYNAKTAVIRHDVAWPHGVDKLR